MPENANCSSKRSEGNESGALWSYWNANTSGQHTQRDRGRQREGRETDTWPGHVKWCANLINNWCQQQHLPVKCWVVLGRANSFGCGLSSAVLGLHSALTYNVLPFPVTQLSSHRRQHPALRPAACSFVLYDSFKFTISSKGIKGLKLGKNVQFYFC